MLAIREVTGLFHGFFTEWRREQNPEIDMRGLNLRGMMILVVKDSLIFEKNKLPRGNCKFSKV